MVSHLFFADNILIFLEASTNQVSIFNACMNDFRISFGQRINMEKTRIFFSCNVNHMRTVELSASMGFHLMDDLGKYLEVPLLYSRVNKAIYNNILDKVAGKLSFWKISHLSLARRTTLVQSMTNAIPNYTMQMFVFPLVVCDKLDKSNRPFLWGCTEGKRKLHFGN